MGGTIMFKYVTLFLIIHAQLKTSDGKVGTVITVATGIMDVAELGKRIYDFIQDVDGSKKKEDISNEELLARIESSIEAAKTEVIMAMLALSRQERIENALVLVHSSMIDLGKIVSATDPDIYEEYKNEFVKNYEYSNVAVHVRFLAELLTYQAPGQDFQLLQHIVDINRCSNAPILEFTDYYLNLVQEGIALHTVYDYLTKGFGPERVLEDEWNDGLQRIQSDINEAFENCLAQFWSLVTSDFQSSSTTQALAENNAVRFGVFHWTDAMFYAPIGTFQFHYRKHIAKMVLFQHTDYQNKIGVFGRRATMPDIALTREIETSLEAAGLSVPARDNERAAAQVGEAVEQHIIDMGYSVEAIVVYFVGPGFEQKGFLKDDGSPVVTYTMRGVTLNYDDETTGVFNVSVYPSREASGEHAIGGAGINIMCTMTYLMATILLALRYIIP